MARKRERTRKPRRTGSDSESDLGIISDAILGEPVKEASENEESSSTTEREGTKKMAGLDPAQIKSLLSGARTKGMYISKLGEFVESGQNGVQVDEEWEEFEDKKATTLKQGFDNAKENKAAPDGSEHVKVVVSNDKVYLINMAIAAQEGSAPEAEAVEA